MEGAVVVSGVVTGSWGCVVSGCETALAIEAAYRCQAQSLFDAYIFVTAKINRLEAGGIRTLAPDADTLDAFINETARALGQVGIAQLAGDAKRKALLDYLRGTRALLIYDNLETLTKAEQESLADWLRFLPSSCKAMLTSRRRGGEGGLWLRLERLEWDAARQIIVSAMQGDAGLRAKLERAGEARWQALYDETSGSPLALTHILGLLRVRVTLTRTV